ncbi:MAG TPA: cephalosporin hydroxylase family protein [Terriglobia bacterium]|nr:cephalosporin hydroxylase family protein [Terriglobia bacterium]
MSRSTLNTPHQAFRSECVSNARQAAEDEELRRKTHDWFVHSSRYKYSYNFTWLGRPVIQFPQDIVAMQELIWQTRPDLIIETGIAHGGSLIFSASMLALIDYTEAVEARRPFDPMASQRHVLGVDIDIRAHNRAAIEAHPLSHKIQMIQGSSIDGGVIAEVHARAKNYSRVLVCLDSNHTHDHVLAELEAYAPLTSPESYCVVFDTIVEEMPDEMFPDRPWGQGDNPRTAVREYLRRLEAEGRRATDGGALRLEIDKDIENKLLVTVAPDGYLKRV